MRHHYEKDGKKYYRISQVAKLAADFHDPEGKAGLEQWQYELRQKHDAVSAYLEASARGGDILHGLLEREALTGESILSKIEKKCGKIVSVEQAVYNDELGIAGTYDAEFTEAIGDYKSSRCCRLSHLIQCSFYAKTRGKNKAYIIYNFGGNKQGFSVKEVDVEKYYAMLVEYMSSIKS